MDNKFSEQELLEVINDLLEIVCPCSYSACAYVKYCNTPCKEDE
jgi:hypothetical protein